MELEKNNEIKIKLEKWELPVSHGDNMLNTEHSVQYFDWQHNGSIHTVDHS